MAKDYNGILKSLKITGEIIIILLAVGMAFAVLRERVNRNTDDIAVNAESIKGIGENTSAMTIDMSKMMVMQGVISEDMKDIKEEIKK